jgi:hypothetical protein
VVQIKFNALDDIQRAVMQNFSSADAKNFLNELTARYCESQTQQTINACTLFKQKGSFDGEAVLFLVTFSNLYSSCHRRRIA